MALPLKWLTVFISGVAELWAMAPTGVDMGIYPGNREMVFWPAVSMAASGQMEERLPLLKKVFAMDRHRAELLKCLPAVGQFPDDPELLAKILALLPKNKGKKWANRSNQLKLRKKPFI